MLKDVDTGEALIVARPQLERFPSIDVIDLIEHLAHLWCSPGGRTSAAQGLTESLDNGQPLFVLHSLNWVHVMWIVAVGMRTRRYPVDDLIRRLRLQHQPADMDHALVEGATERIKIGLLGEMRGDPKAHAIFDREATLHQKVTRAILQVSLELMNQTQEIMRDALGFRLENCAMSVARNTTSLYCSLPPFHFTDEPG
ncbi:hypothetical protein [Actinomadura sp. NTSP31]|uniref:hypothetical protein n=1 Tax=Actinomadura sp. NTSP31 TaxID=1735447 RepID=UPI0035C1FAC6